MQTILGAGGAIGTELARILPEYDSRVRLVARHPEALLPENELFPADLLDPEAVSSAVAGSDVAYLVAGLPYKTRVWREQWPQLMRNVIEACKTHDCKLVFFDNIYMYDCDHLGAMDEQTPVRPTSKKGAVRTDIYETLMEAVDRGEIQALVARSADFYGPGKLPSSVLTHLVFDRLALDKSGQWFLSLDHVHSFTYTLDAARATAMLGNDDGAFGEVWHLPTAANPMTGRQWIDAIAAEFGIRPRYQVVTNTTMKIMGFLIPVLRELQDMAYQYDRDYVFSSKKFESRYGFETTSYAQGLTEIMNSDYR